MELWFTENHTDSIRFSIKIKQHVYSEKSRYQQIDILDSYELGRILVLDGFIMLTEKDEYIYHEMITHVPMATNPDIKRVLVIGAGDGGTIRELTRFKNVEHIDMVEIDQRVVEVCKEYLPQTACRLDDPRVHIYYEDGLKYVRGKDNEYDLIIVDSTDPFGTRRGAFHKGVLRKLLQGAQRKRNTGQPARKHVLRRVRRDNEARPQPHKELLPDFAGLSGAYPDLPLRTLAVRVREQACSHPVADQHAEWWLAQGLKTKYYNQYVHSGCFALPNNVRDVLRETKPAT